MPELVFTPYPIAALADLKSPEAKAAGEDLAEYGFCVTVEHPLEPGTMQAADAYAAELFERWPEVMKRCSRTHDGQRGPTDSGEEAHVDINGKMQKPEQKRYYSFQSHGQGLPIWLRHGPDPFRAMTSVMHHGNVAVASVAAASFDIPEGMMKLALTHHGHSAGRINIYGPGDFSNFHLDTAAGAALKLVPPFQIKKDGEVYDVVVEGNPNDAFGHNFGKSASLFMAGNIDLAVWHGVPPDQDTKISWVWFTHFAENVFWPHDADYEGNPARVGDTVMNWCRREFGRWGVLDDKPAGNM